MLWRNLVATPLTLQIFARYLESQDIKINLNPWYYRHLTARTNPRNRRIVSILLYCPGCSTFDTLIAFHAIQRSTCSFNLVSTVWAKSFHKITNQIKVYNRFRLIYPFFDNWRSVRKDDLDDVDRERNVASHHLGPPSLQPFSSYRVHPLFFSYGIPFHFQWWPYTFVAFMIYEGSPR